MGKTAFVVLLSKKNTRTGVLAGVENKTLDKKNSTLQERIQLKKTTVGLDYTLNAVLLHEFAHPSITVSKLMRGISRFL